MRPPALHGKRSGKKVAATKTAQVGIVKQKHGLCKSGFYPAPNGGVKRENGRHKACLRQAGRPYKKHYKINANGS